jgi:hypothetical protein
MPPHRDGHFKRDAFGRRQGRPRRPVQEAAEQNGQIVGGRTIIDVAREQRGSRHLAFDSIERALDNPLRRRNA